MLKSFTTLTVLTANSRWTWVSGYQNVSILDFVGVKDDGGDGDNWSYKTYKDPVVSSPPTNQHPAFTGWMPSCHPTNSVRALKRN